MAENQIAGQKPARIDRKTIYRSPWVNLFLDSVRLPDGQIIPDFHLLDFEREAVAAIVENERGQILFVHAYRYPTDSVELEIPAGGIDPGETVLQAAEREVREESGLITQAHEYLHSFYPMNGNSNKVFHLVRCRSAGGQIGDFDTNEILTAEWVEPDTIRRMIRAGKIQDGYTLAAMLWVLADL